MDNSIAFAQYINDINAGIDAVRADLWDTADEIALRQPTDNYQRAHDAQAQRAIIWGAIMDYRDGYLSYGDLFELLYSYDPTITGEDVDYLTSGEFNV